MEDTFTFLDGLSDGQSSGPSDGLLRIAELIRENLARIMRRRASCA